MTKPEQTPEEPAGDEGKTFTQADIDAAVDKIAAKIRAEERRKVAEKFADYDDLKAKAEGAKTAEERIAALEQDITESKIQALRATYAADVPEKLRPLLTGSTDEELKSQRDLILDGESERKRKSNVSPREGSTEVPAGDDPKRQWLRSLQQD